MTSTPRSSSCSASPPGTCKLAGAMAPVHLHNVVRDRVWRLLARQTLRELAH